MMLLQPPVQQGSMASTQHTMQLPMAHRTTNSQYSKQQQPANPAGKPRLWQVQHQATFKLLQLPLHLMLLQELYFLHTYHTHSTGCSSSLAGGYPICCPTTSLPKQLCHQHSIQQQQQQRRCCTQACSRVPAICNSMLLAQPCQLLVACSRCRYQQLLAATMVLTHKLRHRVKLTLTWIVKKQQIVNSIHSSSRVSGLLGRARLLLPLPLPVTLRAKADQRQLLARRGRQQLLKQRSVPATKSKKVSWAPLPWFCM
jgi:hypothetical protein